MADVRIPSVVTPTSHRVTTDDGLSLQVTERTATTRPAACVVIQAALGTPQRRYGALAAYLAEHGFATISYDYRDIGVNRSRGVKASKTTVSVWGRSDQTAVLAWARARFPESRLILLGHSMGGQILGFTPRTSDLDGVVLLSAQSTYVDHWDGASRWTMRAMWGVGLPVLNRAFGYMPGWAFGGEDLPPGCTPEGTRWALRPSFMGDEAGVAENLARLRCPVRAYSFADDTFHAPKAAVAAFLAQLPNAQVEHRHVAPADYGLARFGHFGCLSTRSRPFWNELRGVLQSLATGSPAPRRTAVAPAPKKARDRVSRLPMIETALRRRTKLTLREVFVDLVRFSRGVDVPSSVSLTEDVRYRIVQDPGLGELPVVKPPPRTVAKGLPMAVRWKLAPTVVGNDRYASAAEAHEDALRTFGSMPEPEHFECSEDHLGDAWLHRMMTTKFSLWLETHARPSRGRTGAAAADKPAYAFDLEFMRELEAGPGYERHGGKVVLDEDRVLSITHHGREYYPGDEDWELVKYKVRACGFAWATLLHTVMHAREASKTFTATHMFLPHTHPLRALLLPYVYGTHRNVARLQRTVVGLKGVTAAVGGFRSGPEALAFVAKRTGIRLPTEHAVTWPEHYQDVRALWDALRAHVAEYVALHRFDAGVDPALERWLRYLGTHVHPRLYTSALSPESDLGLVDVLAYLMFVGSVMHYAVGHIMNGTTDPRYISGSVRVSDSRDLWSIVSSRDECLIRLAVYATINRHGYRITHDFSELIPDTRGKAIVRDLAHAMQQRAALLEAENRDRAQPRLIVPSSIYSSPVQ